MTLALELPRSLDAFDELTPAVDDFLRESGVEGRAVQVAHLVLEEVLRNLVEHGRGPADAPLAVELRVDPPLLRIVVEDGCEPYDPREAPAFDVDAPLEARRAGGMGIHLLRTMTEDLRYERVEGRNRLEADVALADRKPA